jgi:hypothetical protein
VVIFTAQNTPDVKIELIETKSIGKDLYRVRVRLINSNAMPSMSYSAVKNKLYPQDMLKVSGSSAKVVSGGRITDIYRDQVSYKEYKPEIQFCQVPGFGKIEYQFLVSGKGSVKVDFESRKAGKKSLTIQLK